jgi:hypothetical protein
MINGYNYTKMDAAKVAANEATCRATLAAMGQDPAQTLGTFEYFKGKGLSLRGSHALLKMGKTGSIFSECQVTGKWEEKAKPAALAVTSVKAPALPVVDPDLEEFFEFKAFKALKAKAAALPF